MAKKQSKLVVAIEIGHVNSGYAYGIGKDNRYQINTATYGYGLPSNRVPTALLLKKDGTFDSFGDYAKDKFMSISLQGMQDQYKYFDKIQDVQEVDKHLVVYDSSKTIPTPAENVYSIIIDHLYDICMTQVETFPTRDFETNLVHVIVPNRTNDIYDVIKSALERTKLRGKTVNMVQDTDAAATYCRHQLLSKSKRKKSFILANLGGYSSKFCFQPISSKGKYEELVEHSSLLMGGESVTDLFFTENMFDNYGELDEFKRNHAYDLMCIRRVFDENKHKFDGNNESMIMELPSSFVGVLQENGNFNKLNVTEDNKIRLTEEKMKEMFMKSLNEMVGIMKALDEDIKQREAPIFLVGGFSESPYLREVIKKELKPKDVILVPEPQIAVLKGAVIMGFDDDTSRAEFDYGFIRQDNPSGSSDFINITYKGKDVVFQTILRKGKMKDKDTFHVTLRIPEDEKKKAIVLYKRKTSDSGKKDGDDQLNKEKETLHPVNEWGNEVNINVKLSIKDNQFAFDMCASDIESTPCLDVTTQQETNKVV